MNLKKAYFITGFALLLYFFLVFDVNFSGPDEPVYFAYTKSLVEDGDLNIADQLYNDYGQYVSPTYNLPDFHTHGGVVFWAPFYAYGKFVYLLLHRLNITNILHVGLDTVTKCVMSFSTLILAFFTLFFTFLLCSKFFSVKLALGSTLLLFFATPFSYFTLFETGQGQIAAGMLLVIAIFTLYCYAEDFKRTHWFLLGIFLSVLLAVRAELWSQLLFFIFPYILTLCLFKRIRWNACVFLFVGLLPVFALREVNAYLKFGTFLPEEMNFIYSFLKFKASFLFDGLFSSFRGIFYSFPIILVCLAGAIACVFAFLKNSFKRQVTPQDCFFVAASLYLFLKLYSLSGIFSPSGDGLTGRCFLTEFSIFVLLYGYFLNRQKGKLRWILYVLSGIFLVWNLLVMAEYIAGFDWLYVTFSPGPLQRLFNLQYIFFPLFCAKDLWIKLLFCLPLAGIIAGILYLVFKKNYKRGQAGGYLRVFSWFTVTLALSYLIITLLNIGNNRNNAQRLKAVYLKNARIIQTSALALSEYEEEEMLWELYKVRAYHALRGDINKMQTINRQRERIFGRRPRLRQDYLPIQVFRVHPAFYNTGLRYKQAIDCYEKAVSLDPQDFEACISLGDIYSFIGDYPRAIQSYKKALAINPNLMRLYVTLGNLYESMEELDLAASCYQGIIQRNPSMAEAYRGLASINNSKHDYSQAAAYYKKYLELNPASAETYLSLGDVYRNAVDYNQAIIYYRKCLERNPQSSEAYNSLADMYCKISDFDKAIEAYIRVIHLKPFNPWVYFDLGQVYNTKGDAAQVLKQVAILKRLNRQDLAIRLNRELRKE
jgi:tetratricopeptide (TPR) repeat protein